MLSPDGQYNQYHSHRTGLCDSDVLQRVSSMVHIKVKWLQRANIYKSGRGMTCAVIAWRRVI